MKIYEMPVYDGRTKEWRVLNINTGTVYSTTHETEAEAYASIAGEKIKYPSDNRDVEAVSLREIHGLIDSTPFPWPIVR